jgi:hypothetical protein
LDALANKGGSQADRETKVDLITKDSFK